MVEFTFGIDLVAVQWPKSRCGSFRDNSGQFVTAWDSYVKAIKHARVTLFSGATSKHEDIAVTLILDIGTEYKTLDDISPHLVSLGLYEQILVQAKKEWPYMNGIQDMIQYCKETGKTADAASKIGVFTSDLQKCVKDGKVEIGWVV